MKCNVGGVDRNTRLGVGAALLAVGILAPMGRKQKAATLVAGAAGLLTGFSHY
jgi:hypothetical protein